MGMGTSICIASGKGGVGKSTIAVNLGVALSKLGVDSIVVDGDVEGTSVGSLVGANPSVPSIHDCLSGELDAEDAIIHLNGVNYVIGGLDIEKLMSVDMSLFKDIIGKLMERFEIVIVDCPPGLGVDSVNVISSCVAMLLVVTPDITSMINALKTVMLAEKVGCTIIGTLVNKSSSEYDIPDAQISNVLGIETIGRLSEDEEVKKALSMGEPLMTYNPESQFSLELVDVASSLIGK